MWKEALIDTDGTGQGAHVPWERGCPKLLHAKSFGRAETSKLLQKREKEWEYQFKESFKIYYSQ